METALTWSRENVEVIIAILSAFVALIGALLSRAETRKQQRILLENVRQQIDAQSLGWGNQAIAALGQAAMFARTRKHQTTENAFLQQRVNIMLGLSILVERGRLFFPNLKQDGEGVEKMEPYKGQRPPILDALMFAYREVEAMTRTGGPTAENSADYIEQCRRLLVTELQAYLDPHRRDAVVGRYDDRMSAARKDAIKIAHTLRVLLQSRRPGLNVDGKTETVQ